MWMVGEESALTARGRLHAETGEGGPVVWHKMGSGWSWPRKHGEETDHAADAAEGWAQIKRDLAAEAHRFYVLDEYTYPQKWGWVDADDEAETLTTRPGTQHDVVTGRDAPPARAAAADLVGEMTKV